MLHLHGHSNTTSPPVTLFLHIESFLFVLLGLIHPARHLEPKSRFIIPPKSMFNKADKSIVFFSGVVSTWSILSVIFLSSDSE